MSGDTADLVAAAATLREAVTNTDLAGMQGVLCTRSHAHLQTIADIYRERFSRVLSADVKDYFSGEPQRLFESLLMSPSQFSARELNDSFVGIGTDEDATIEVCCGAVCRQVRARKHANERETNRQTDRLTDRQTTDGQTNRQTTRGVCSLPVEHAGCACARVCALRAQILCGADDELIAATAADYKSTRVLPAAAVYPNTSQHLIPFLSGFLMHLVKAAIRRFGIQI